MSVASRLPARFSLTYFSRWTIPVKRKSTMPAQQVRRRNNEMSDASATNFAAVFDNPCWGGPNRHDLCDLLNILDRSRSILFESDSYIVLDKPPDLRMDGPFPSTVHKLLTYWYPPDSIKEQSNLMEHVSRLERHNDLKDNVLRPCHQLDYATSGVLLIGRTKEAAAAACRAFYHRQAKKKYLALVHGHLDVPKNLPVVSLATLEKTFPSEEKKYRKSKGPKSKKGTFVGYLPPSAIFVKYRSWKQAQQQATSARAGDVEAVKTKKQRREEKKIDRSSVMDPKDFENLCRDCLPLTQEDQELMLEKSWRDIRANYQWRQAFQHLADEHNKIMREKQKRESDSGTTKQQTSLPHLFQVDEERGEQSFYINAEVAEVKNDFRVRLRSELYPDAAVRRTPSSESDGSVLDFKPALTKCVIMAKGTLNGQPVTKVRLEPQTGRRHQLRLHIVVTGHSIVGDVTYEFPNDPTDLSLRMCLHAYSLALPAESGEDDKSYSFCAPDPFCVNSKQEITIIGPGGSDLALDEKKVVRFESDRPH